MRFRDLVGEMIYLRFPRRLGGMIEGMVGFCN